jgi:hypothetical protein|nr:MAG TPA: MAEBL protein [Caudoviricetes sp.]
MAIKITQIKPEGAQKSAPSAKDYFEEKPRGENTEYTGRIKITKIPSAETPYQRALDEAILRASAAGQTQLPPGSKKPGAPMRQSEYQKALDEAMMKRAAADRKNRERGRRSYNRSHAQEVREITGDRTKKSITPIIKSAAAGYAADMVGAADTLLRAPSGLNYAASQERGEIEASKKNIAAYTEKLKAAKTEEERQQWQTLIDRNKRLIEINSKAADERVKNYQDATRGAQEKLQGTYQKLRKTASDNMEKANEGLTPVGKYLNNVGVAGAQMAADAALGGGSALGPMFLRVFGGNSQEAAEAADKPGMSAAEQLDAQNRALLYGTASGAVSIATEKISNVAAPFKKAFGGGFLDKAIDGAIAKMNGNAAGRLALSFLSEGGEEVIEDIVQPALQTIYNGQSAGQNYSELDAAEILNDFLVGGALGLIGSGVEGIHNADARLAAERAAGEAAAPTAEQQNTMPAQPAAAQEGAQGVGEGNLAPVPQSAAQGAQEASTSVDTNPKNHTPEEQKRVEDYRAATDSGIVAFVQKVRTLKNPRYRNSVRYPVSDVSAREASAVLDATGVNTSGFTNILTGGAVDHIEKRHGASGKADKSMQDLNDLGRVGYILENFDGAELLLNEDGTPSVSDVWKNSDGTPAARMLFTKKVDGVYYTAVATPDSNAGVIAIESAFMSKEKGSTGTVLNMENISPQVTPEAPQRANASFDNTVPQESGGVKAQEGTESAQTAQADNTTTAGGMNHGGQEVQNHAGGAEFADTAKRGTPEAADAASALPDGAAERGERERGGRESGRIPREVRNVGGEDGNALTVQQRLAASGISQFISPREANVPNGASGDNTVTIFDEVDWDQELIGAADWAKSKGVKKVTALLGVINIEKNGRTGKAFGVFNADTGEIFVNAGSVQRSVSETIEHETAHYLAEVARRENVRTFMRDVQSRYSSEEWGKAYDAYFDRYAALTGDYVGMSENDIELYVWEEIMGDAYAEIDQYDEKASRFNREAENALSQSAPEAPAHTVSEPENVRLRAVDEPKGRGPPERFSLNEFEDGRRFVDVQADQAQFDGLNDKQKTKLAIQIIKERFSGKVIGIDNRVFVNGRSAAEYGHPTKNISPDIRDAKMRASTELDNLIDAGTNFRTEPDGKDGHIHHNTAGDFRYFDTTFKVGNEYYKGVVNILPVSKGLLLKDITKIESITQDISSSYGQSPKSTFLRDASMSSISRNGGNVKYSAFNEEVARQLAGEEQEKQRYSAESDEFYERLDEELADEKEIDRQERAYEKAERDGMRTDFPSISAEWKTKLERARAAATNNIKPSGFDSYDAYLDALDKQHAADRAERLRVKSRDEFKGTKALDELGVKIANSAGIYHNAEQLLANDKAAKSIQKATKRAEQRLGATRQEKRIARDIANGERSMADIPRSVKKSRVLELVDYYTAQKATKTGLLQQQRIEINDALREQARELIGTEAPEINRKGLSKLFDPSKGLVLYHRTPQRIMRALFGWKQGQKINEAVFEPVYENEQERKRFINRLFDEVRTFEGADGKKSALNKDESAFAQKLKEGRTVEELVEKSGVAESIRAAAENLKNGAEMKDAAREFNLDEGSRNLTRQYADWLQTQEDYAAAENIDRMKIENAIEKYTELYDKLYAAINDFLVAHGYEPIGFIKGYAPHFQPEAESSKLESALKAIGVDLGSGVGKLPTSIAGLTKSFKPNKRYNPFFQHRRGNETDYDIVKGFETYVDYASDVLYHTDDIMRVRQMANYLRSTFAPEEMKADIDQMEAMRYAPADVKEEYLRDKKKIADDTFLSYEDLTAMMEQYTDEKYRTMEDVTEFSDLVTWLDDYANKLAGKQLFEDRLMEREVGREALNGAKKLNRMFARANVAGNLSSALNQTAQLPMIATELGQKNTWRAVGDILRWKTTGMSAFRGESDFLTEKSGIDYIQSTKGEKALKVLFSPLEKVDTLVSTIAVRGKYRMELDAGKSPKEAMKAADRWARDIMGTRSKGSVPLTFQSKNLIAQMMNMFQVEAANTFEHVTQDRLGPGFKEMAAKIGKDKAIKKLASDAIAYMLLAFLLNRLDEELYGGTPAPFDVLGMGLNAVASGNGLTSSDLLKTIMDNVTESFFGERLFDTDPDAMNDEFDGWAAAEDTLYNISNDVPYVRNVSGLLGVGDQTLPMPDIVGALSKGKKALKNADSPGEFWAEIARQLMGLAGDTLPGGRQAEKTAQGIEAVARGGSYKGSGDSKRLQYPVESPLEDPWTALRAAIFGKNALPESRTYWAAGGKALSAAQTRLYEDLVDSGLSRKRAYEILKRFNDATADLEADRDKNGNPIGGSKKEKIVKEINKLPLSRKQKNMLYLSRGYSEKDLNGLPWN